jgi:hypothetical protein
MATTSMVNSGGRAYSMNCRTIESMRSISSTIDALLSSSRSLNSISSRNRVNGVRMSCDTPARTTARSASMACKSPASWLKRRLSSEISVGPLSRNRDGRSPRDNFSIERARLASGRFTRRLIRMAPMSASNTAVAVTSSQLPPSWRSRRLGSAISQYWSPSMSKLTHNAFSPLTLLATSVLGPSSSFSLASTSCPIWRSGHCSIWSCGSSG